MRVRRSEIASGLVVLLQPRFCEIRYTEDSVIGATYFSMGADTEHDLVDQINVLNRYIRSSDPSKTLWLGQPLLAKAKELTGPISFARALSYVAMSWLGSNYDEAVSSLMKIGLQNESAMVRKKAVFALGFLDWVQNDQDLMAAMDDPDPEVSEVSRTAGAVMDSRLRLRDSVLTKLGV